MSSSADGAPRFDPQAAAQQMLDLQSADLVAGSARLPAQGFTGGSMAVPPAQPAASVSPAFSVAQAPLGAVDSGALPPSLSDRGNARLFVRLYRDQFRHVEGLGWFAWDG
ncbi:hypothetical protein ABZT06_50100, partial [Streptomyces sp. NPDC005483]